MAAPIVQIAKFKASAKELYAAYMGARSHSAFIGGAAVEISAKPGSKFSAFDGDLLGTTLHVVPGKLIVQAWRSASWKKSDPDSILTLTFRDEGGEGVIELVHINVPDHDRDGVTQGWREYYWKPLRVWLARRT
jgi:activator of HSP90 ATPase